MAHNTQKVDNYMNYHANRIKHDPIRISFWGMVRQPEFNCRLCDIFGNDERFFISYHGEGESNQIKKYCEAKKYKNIQFTGRYSHKEICGFAEKTDIIHCIYEFEKDVKMKTALQVKLYDGMKYHIPLLLHAGSYSAEYVKNFGVAFDVVPLKGKKVADEVYQWYQELNPDDIDAGYERMMEMVHKDDDFFRDRLLHFVRNENDI